MVLLYVAVCVVPSRYSEAVTNYAERLMVCGGRRSLVMDDWSQAELHHLDKIELEALMARLSVKEQQALLAMPTVELASVVSMASLANGTAAASSSTGKSPLITPSSHASSDPSETEGPSPGGFSVIPEEEGTGTPSASGSGHADCTDKKVEAGDQGSGSKSSLKSTLGQVASSELLPEPRQRQKRKGNKS